MVALLGSECERGADVVWLKEIVLAEDFGFAHPGSEPLEHVCHQQPIPANAGAATALLGSKVTRARSGDISRVWPKGFLCH